MGVMKNSELDRMIKLHEEISRCRRETVLNPEISLETYLLHTFHAGNFFFFIYYLPEQKMEFCNEGIQSVLGIAPEEWSLTYIIDNMHPDDKEVFVQNEQALIPVLRTVDPSKLTEYKVRYDFRLKNKDGKYRRILHQAITLHHDEEGSVIRTFCIYTDITHLRADGRMNLALISLNGEKSFYDIKPDGSYSLADQALSSRELEIIRLIARGYKSKGIAEALGISINTVHNHRKKIIEKYGVYSTDEIIQLGLDQGWL